MRTAILIGLCAVSNAIHPGVADSRSFKILVAILVFMDMLEFFKNMSRKEH